MRDDDDKRTVKIELLSQLKLEAEFRKIFIEVFDKRGELDLMFSQSRLVTKTCTRDIQGVDNSKHIFHIQL